MAEKFGDLAPSDYPGERLGLPEEGSGSVGRIGRRFIAIAIDWALASLPAYLLVGGSHPELWNLL
ncbi:MAG: RDD family protein, partial [Leucobacter sp.]|nr:RDD family protein [Leucobacter sp.]